MKILRGLEFYYLTIQLFRTLIILIIVLEEAKLAKIVDGMKNHTEVEIKRNFVE